MISVPTQTWWKLLGEEGGVLEQRWMMDGCRAVVGGGGGGRQAQRYQFVTLLQGGNKPFRALRDVWIRWRHCHSPDTQRNSLFYRQECCSVSLFFPNPLCLTTGSHPVIDRAHQSGFVPYLGFSEI